MNKVFRKVLMSKFDGRMRELFPDFKLDKYDRNPIRSSIDRDYVLFPAKGVRLYISLVPSRSGWDEFRCVISWSKLDRFPEPKPAFYGPDSFGEEEADIPLRMLCGEYDSSWKIERAIIPPPANPNEMFDDYRGMTEGEADIIIEPLANDLFEKLNRCGRPFIQAFVEYLLPPARQSISE